MKNNIIAKCGDCESFQDVIDVELHKEPATITMVCGHTITITSAMQVSLAQSKAMPGYALSKEDCEKIGGHCYLTDGGVITTIPAIYHRTCKHCGHKQEGREVQPIEWKDDI